MILGRSLMLGCAVWMLAGCGSDKNGGSAAGPGAGGDAGSGAGTAGSTAAGASSGGAGSTAGSAGSGGGLLGNSGAGSGGAAGATDPTYDGIDLSSVGMAAPASCTGGLVAGVLTLALDASVPAVVLGVVGGEIQANGVTCTSSSAEHATPSNVSSIVVSGSAADEKLYLDLSKGSFGALSGKIQIDLGDGSDQLIVIGTTGDDRLFAGADGEDTVVDVTGDGTPDVRAKHIESLLLTSGAGADQLNADGSQLSLAPVAIPVWLYGGSGPDTLRGGAAADRLAGGSGEDVFLAGAAPSGADTFDGGADLDTADFSARTSALTITLAGGADDGEAGENADVQASVEIVLGGSGNDSLTGNAEANQLNGGPGDDTLSGGAGDDYLYGGDGNDTISGDDGNDYIYGEVGDDILHGGDGDDLVDGYSGKNVVDGGASDGDICVYTALDSVSGCEL